MSDKRPPYAEDDYAYIHWYEDDDHFDDDDDDDFDDFDDDYFDDDDDDDYFDGDDPEEYSIPPLAWDDYWEDVQVQDYTKPALRWRLKSSVTYWRWKLRDKIRRVLNQHPNSDDIPF